jgi:Sulfotransferase family
MPLRDTFIIGAPRSGTTWLQATIATHEAVASPPETGIFRQLLAPWERAWNTHAQEVERATRGETPPVGMPVVLTREQHVDLMRSVYLQIRERIFLLHGPTAQMLLEKSPVHSLEVELIRVVRPDARFVHLVRDPRDTVASILAASETWNRSSRNGGWPATVELATGRVVRYAAAAFDAADADDTLVVRYEDLRRDPETTLATVWAFLELPDGLDAAVAASRRDLDATVGRLAVGGELGGSWSLPRGFSNATRTGPPRTLSRYERWYVEQHATDLLAMVDDPPMSSRRIAPIHQLRRVFRRTRAAGRRARCAAFGR